MVLLGLKNNPSKVWRGIAVLFFHIGIFLSVEAAAVVFEFGSANYYPTATNPLAIAVADFNHDGKLDIVTINAKPDVVSVLLGEGDGTFLPHIEFPVAYSPSALAVGDLNNDSHTDIAVLCSTNISILLGDGSNNFSVTNLTNNLNGFSSAGLCLADLNYDGNLDLASASGRVAFGNGNGFFGASFSPGGLYGSLPSSVSAIDMNLDGSPDLIFSGYYSVYSFSILTNSGNGTFGTARNYGPGPAGYSLVVDDLNGDGRQDIAMLTSGTLITRTNSGGQLEFGITNQVPLGNGFAFGSLAVADFDFNGSKDLVVRGQQGILKFLNGNNHGFFQTNTAISFQFPNNNNPRTVATGDFNGDGRPDVVFIGLNAVGVLLNETPPELRINIVSGHFQIDWGLSGYTLQTSTDSLNNWQPFPVPPVTISNRNFVSDFISGNKFYRLKK